MENNPKLKFARINNQHNNDNHESSSSSAINFISVPTSSPSSATVSLSSSLSVSEDIAPAPAPSRSGELVTDADGPFSRDKHDMIVRIFNFYKETVHRFPSAHQDKHDEDLLNLLILQCIGTTSRPASWNRPSTYVSPYTPIKPSKMNINDLPKDCIDHLMNQFKSLQELVEKAFVCAAWVPAVAKIVSGRIHSLKVFESEENIELYQEHALMQYNLARLDLAAGVHQTGDRKEDYIFVQPFRDYEKNLDIFEALFTKVTYLVLHTLNIDHAGLIRCMDKLTSITLFELPNSDKQQNSIWEALNSAPVLRHVHIFYANGEFPFEADKMDFLTRIESFTLDNYTQDNLFDILKRLGPQLRCLQIGPFANGDEVLERLIEQNPDMVAKLTQLSVRLDEKCMEKASYNAPYEESYLVHKKMLQLIVDHFTELNYLDMEFASLMFSTEVIHSLGKLPKLTELRFANRKIYSGFLSFTDQQLLGVPNHHDHLLPTPLTNIRKVYLVKNNSYDDCHFLARLFEDDQNNDQDAGMLEDFAADPINVFQGIEQVTFVINGGNWMGSFYGLRNSIFETIPPQYWLRLRLYNVEVGKVNEGFFARNEHDVAQIVRKRNVLNNARRALVDVKDGWMLDDVREQNDGFDDDDDDHFGDENDNDRDARIAAQANQALEANQFWQAAQNALRQNIPGHANERIDENPLQENLQQRLDDMREGFIRERVQFELNIVARNAQPRRRNRRQQQHPYNLLRNR